MTAGASQFAIHRDLRSMARPCRAVALVARLPWPCRSPVVARLLLLPLVPLVLLLLLVPLLPLVPLEIGRAHV